MSNIDKDTQEISLRFNTRELDIEDAIKDGFIPRKLVPELYGDEIQDKSGQTPQIVTDLTNG